MKEIPREELAKVKHQKGVILDIDPKGAAMFGLPIAEIIGLNFFQEIPEAHAKTLKRMMEAGNQKPFKIKLRLSRINAVKDLYIQPASEDIPLDQERIAYFKVL